MVEPSDIIPTADRVQPSDIVRRLKDLNPDSGDVTYAVAKGVLGAFPGAGPLLQELFGAMVIPPLQKREGEFIELIASSLVELSDKVEAFDFDTLPDNPAFISAVAIASPIALRTHQKEKLEALRNALLNVALGIQPDENKQQFFLRLIDELNTDYLKILEYCDPRQAAIRRESRFGDETLMEYYTRVKPNADRHWWAYLRMIVATLNARALLLGDGLEPAIINGTAVASDIAIEFLEFIKSPVELDAALDVEKPVE
jgi:hypothetical protein